ncbi:hypothetical protein D9601_02660 [Sphingomonas sp. MA1305]|uniref:hypothetical protein n=1 Tax=Sphingomonas sp. MA1305 TaxID=2479204 RepID=UPI0018DF92A2|nr:hypothetical protein [Sphingomonas sp. MA1305]MBI0474266.1 hypothetical protein [Sphingomonas sp. MA1305]
MIRVRRPAIVFAIGSAIYWQIIADFLSQVNFVAGVSDVPYWEAALLNVVPALVYAVIALWFCHWLARRVLKQAKAFEVR